MTEDTTQQPVTPEELARWRGDATAIVSQPGLVAHRGYAQTVLRLLDALAASEARLAAVEMALASIATLATQSVNITAPLAGHIFRDIEEHARAALATAAQPTAEGQVERWQRVEESLRWSLATGDYGGAAGDALAILDGTDPPP